MMFGISDKDLMDPNKIKIINGIAGSGKSTTTVGELRKLGSNFCLASFSNALKFAASDKFGCPTDTICGLEFVNTPYPRYEEKEVLDFDTVVNDEILLDGVECINWMMNNVGKVNIIALTDSRQMLNSENGNDALRAFNKLRKQKNTIYVEITDTKRARDDETRNVYNELFNLESNKLLKIKEASEILHCDIISIDDIDFSKDNTYLCHSNKIEHEIYKRYGICERRDIDLIPKNHISRKKTFDANKYPICDQITATEKRIDSYLQAANIATPTRFQGKEVDKNDNCYFLVSPEDVFTGREIYTVGTRCQSIKSLHIVTVDVSDYVDPKTIHGRKVVSAKHLDLPDHDKSFMSVSANKMADIIKKEGQEGVSYYYDYITSGNNIIYSSIPNAQLAKFADIHDNGEVTFRKTPSGAKRSIRSITKKDTTMHFDYMPKVYALLDRDVMPPRINNPRNVNKKQFNKLCDIYSAFPTVLNNAPMPKAGYLYTEYDPELLNYYEYKGNVVTKGSIITEELANILGESEYVFSTDKQMGCELGRYTYKQCKASKEKKDIINKNFLWGMLESSYYTRTTLLTDGKVDINYVKHSGNNLELVACALWSSLCCVMLNAISSINAKEFYVVTDGLYYNGDIDPVIPDWCDYRIENKDWNDNDKGDEKYKNISFQSYDNLPTDKDLKRAKDREQKRKKRAEMTPEQKAKEAERKRIARAKKKAERENQSN